MPKLGPRAVCWPRWVVFEPLNASLKKINDLAVPLAKQMGLEVLLIEEASERGHRILRVFLEHSDSSQEVNVGECAEFSRAFGTLLDVEADVAGPYDLEVSSPGLNRPLVKPEHFASQSYGPKGAILVLQTRGPLLEHGVERRNFHGRLMRLEGEGEDLKIYLQVDGKEYEISYSQIKKAHLDYFATEQQSASLEARKKKHKETSY